MSGMTRPISTVNVTTNNIYFDSAPTLLRVGSVQGGGVQGGTILRLEQTFKPGYVLMLAKNGIVQSNILHWTAVGNVVTLKESSNENDTFAYLFLAVTQFGEVPM